MAILNWKSARTLFSRSSDRKKTVSTRVCINHKNLPGIIAQFTNHISKQNGNIVTLLSQSKGDFAYTLMDIDKAVDAKEIQSIDGVLRVRVI